MDLFEPQGLCRANTAPPQAVRLAGGWRAALAARRWGSGEWGGAGLLPDAYGRPRPPFAGLAMDRPHLMGIVNVTPDSFSDGGDSFDPQTAIDRGLALAEAGAAIIDVGGESTRPDAPDLDPAIEAARVVPVVRALAERGLSVSIDTRRASVMAAALEAGARIINDVSALADPEALPLVVRHRVPVILMHMRGTPATMRSLSDYGDVVAEVYGALRDRVALCRAAGLADELICLDPGIGFAKEAADNARLIAGLAAFHGLGLPLLLGASRKRFIAALSAGEAPKDRLPGSLMAAEAGWSAGVQIIRVHDVAATRQALAVWQAVGG